MQKLGLNEIREKYLSFFESKGHLRLPSFSLVPENDASLLLINAGMAPLKPYFTGKQTPPKSRVTTCQKCIRTPDIVSPPYRCSRSLKAGPASWTRWRTAAKRASKQCAAVLPRGSSKNEPPIPRQVPLPPKKTSAPPAVLPPGVLVRENHRLCVPAVPPKSFRNAESRRTQRLPTP